MLALGIISEDTRDFVVTTHGAKWLRNFGIDLDEIRRGRRHFARQCLDWSERRHHMAGALGAAVTSRLFDMGWIYRIPGGRAIQITEHGFRGLSREFGVTFGDDWKQAEI